MESVVRAVARGCSWVGHDQIASHKRFLGIAGGAWRLAERSVSAGNTSPARRAGRRHLHGFTPEASGELLRSTDGAERSRRCERCHRLALNELVAVDNELRVGSGTQFMEIHSPPLAFHVDTLSVHAIEQPVQPVR